MSAILAKKLGMTQLFQDDGAVARVTVLEAGPCPVTAVRTAERDGYEAVQLAFGSTREKKHLTKAELGHLKKAGAPPLRHLSEFRDEAGELKVGIRHRRDLRGRQPREDLRHLEGQGVSGHHPPPQLQTRAVRARLAQRPRPGSIGASATPSRVLPGLRGPGHMGSRRATQPGLEVVAVDSARNLLMVRGSVPGPTGGVVEVRSNA